MSTGKYYSCLTCKQLSYPQRLFDTLRDFARAGPLCASQGCGGANELHVVLDFGLEAGNPDCKVLHVFLPRELVTWELAEGKKVTFHPFLVILQRMGDERNSAWLPYWHIVEGGGVTQRKYGQWAPFMDDPQFGDLVAQAREHGYFEGD